MSAVARCTRVVLGSVTIRNIASGMAALDRSMSVSAASSRSVQNRNPRRNNSSASLPPNTTPSPPPRPPPPRSGSTITRPSSRSPQGSPQTAARHVTPPSLPPKQRPLAQASPGSSARAVLPLESDGGATPLASLPPPLIPIPAKLAPPPPKPVPQQPSPLSELDDSANESMHIPVSPSPPKIPARPAIPPRNVDRSRTSITPPPLPQRGSSTLSSTAAHDQVAAVASKDLTSAADAEQESECCVCWEQPKNCALYKCGHVCMCYSCAVGIKKSKDPLCPVCRREISDVIKIFKS